MDLYDLVEVEEYPETEMSIQDLDDYLEYTSNDLEIQETLSKYK